MTKLFFGLICLSSFSLYASDESPLGASWMSSQDAALVQGLSPEKMSYIKTLDRTEQHDFLREASISAAQKTKQDFTEKAKMAQEQPGKFRGLDALLAPYGLSAEALFNECAAFCSDKISSLEAELLQDDYIIVEGQSQEK